MTLTKKLLGLLNRIFDIDPEQFLALRIRYNGTSLSWTVKDCILTTSVNGGSGQNLSIDLSVYTLRQLVNFIAAQPGYSVPSAGTSEQLSLSARVLLDGSGHASQSNGDHLYAYTSLTWVYLDAAAYELKAAAAQIPNALAQMSITTASDDWIDELGGYYGVKRQQGELDASYGPRIIAEVVRPRANNVAMEKAISYYTGQATKVADVIEYGNPFPLYNSAIKRNSLYHFQAEATPRYGLFDVQYGYDLLGGSDQQGFADRVRTIIDRLRAAGTHLRALSLQSGSISDDFTAPPTDDTLRWTVRPGLADTPPTMPTDDIASFAALSDLIDVRTAPGDSSTNTITFNYRYNSLRRYNSKIRHQGGRVVTE